MTRLIFQKGEQKKFLERVLERVDSPSIRGLLQFGLKTSYSSLKNYYTERRSLKKDLFDDLCFLAKINPSEFNYQERKDSWGQVKGGKKSKKQKFKSP